MNLLKSYGATASIFAEATFYPEYYLGRILSQYNNLYKVITEEGEHFAEVSGKFRYQSESVTDFPVVGDFVLLDRKDNDSGNLMIHKVLKRKSVFERKASGTSGQSQIVAANIDLVFLCMSLNKDYNLSRLERYLAVAWSSGATPVLVLTKADLCDTPESYLNEVSAVAAGVDVIVTTSTERASYEKLLPYLIEGVTASFIGSSGVGKSTLINCLAGEELFLTSEIREDDDRGRHTTTRRELLLLPQGGIVIDTPGMRELGVETGNFSKSFSDIEQLISQCKFGDCSHSGEPGCAVKQALDSGELDERRYQNYLKLKKEAKYEGLNSKQIETEKINSMFGGKAAMKEMKNHLKNKKNRF